MKRFLYTIGFMAAVTVVFIALLAWVNGVSKPRIEQNIELQNAKSMLYAFQYLPEQMEEQILPDKVTTMDLPWDDGICLSIKETRIHKVLIPLDNQDKMMLKNSLLTPGDSAVVYIYRNRREQPVGYGFYLRGKGLWGTITAFAAVSVDLKRMLGIDFTEQVETPGLGARITEQGFKKFFRQLNLESFSNDSGSFDPIVMVRDKDQMNTEKSTNILEAITGATQTCNGVLNMLNADLRFYITLIRKNRMELQ